MHRPVIQSLKNMGSSKDHFGISGYCYPEVGNIFVIISVKTKIFSKIFQDFNLGPRYHQFMRKTRVQKSHATVPLKGQ